MLGFPARLAGRLPMLARYVWKNFPSHLTHRYAEVRFGKSWKFRPWLILDIEALEYTEDLLNNGDDKKVSAYREAQLNSSNSVGVMGSIVASVAMSGLSLPDLASVHFVVRGAFIISVIMSLLGVFFAIVQQQSLASAADPQDFRIWLTNGRKYVSHHGKEVYQSSLAGHMTLQAPFEFVAISITAFIFALGLYLTFGWAYKLGESTGVEPDRAVFLAYLIVGVFAALVFGQVIGIKEWELRRRKQKGSGNLIALNLPFVAD